MKKVISILQWVLLLLTLVYFYKVDFHSSFFEDPNLIFVGSILSCLITYQVGKVIKKFMKLKEFLAKKK